MNGALSLFATGAAASFTGLVGMAGFSSVGAIIEPPSPRSPSARAALHDTLSGAFRQAAYGIRWIENCVREHPPSAPASETTISGTGFFVAPNRVVTNNHVVNGCTRNIQVRYPDRASFTATISGQDVTNDLALLQTDMSGLSTASIRLQPYLGEAVATYGFPYSDVLSSGGNFTLGNITALSGIRDDSRFLQTSAPIQPGNSGGALLDMSGSVVGVVVAQLNAVAKNVPQNVNFAIQPSMVMSFLSAKGVTPKLDVQAMGLQGPHLRWRI